MKLLKVINKTLALIGILAFMGLWLLCFLIWLFIISTFGFAYTVFTHTSIEYYIFILCALIFGTIHFFNAIKLAIEETNEI